MQVIKEGLPERPGSVPGSHGGPGLEPVHRHQVGGVSVHAERRPEMTAAEEIRLVKNQQWNRVYYPILLFAAIIALFLSPQLGLSGLGWVIYWVVKGIADFIVLLATVSAIVLQWSDFSALQEYRKNNLDIGRTPKKTRLSILVTSTFTATVSLGAIGTLLIIFREEVSRLF
jgi:hypothetical protein